MRREEKRSSFQLFCSLFRKLLRRRVALYRRGVGERIIFGGEDGFIIKENFEFVKNGKKDGQKGQGKDFRYVKHKENKKRTCLLKSSYPIIKFLVCFGYALHRYNTTQQK